MVYLSISLYLPLRTSIPLRPFIVFNFDRWQFSLSPYLPFTHINKKCIAVSTQENASKLTTLRFTIHCKQNQTEKHHEYLQSNWLVTRTSSFIEEKKKIKQRSTISQFHKLFKKKNKKKTHNHRNPIDQIRCLPKHQTKKKRKTVGKWVIQSKTHLHTSNH